MDFGQVFGQELVWLLPELFVRVVASALLVYGAVVVTSEPRGYPVLRGPRARLSAAVRVVAAALAATAATVVGAGEAVRGGVLRRDPRALAAKACVAVAAAVTLVVRSTPARSAYTARRGLHAREYPLLRLLAVLGRRLLASANDFRRLYRALELQSLCLYVLAASLRGSAFSTEAGLKYFVTGAVASGLLLFGASLVYGFAGTTSFEDVARLLAVGGSSWAPGGLVAGLLLVFVGLCFKLAAAPFHRWVPDVYEGSPTSSTRFFAAVPKLAVVVVRLRLLQTCGGRWDVRAPAVAAVAVASRVVGVLGTFQQERRKRFLAFSAVGHRGYRRLARAAGTLEGVQGALVYTLVYRVRSLHRWTAVTSLEQRHGDVGRPRKYITDLGGLAHVAPALAATVALARFSRAGVPPRAGFAAKRFVFVSARGGGRYVAAVVGVVTSVVGAALYLRWVKVRYFEAPREASLAQRPWAVAVGREASWVLGWTSRVTVVARLQPTPLLVLTHRRALSVAA